MGHTLERRAWLKQAAITIGGITIAPQLMGRDNPDYDFYRPAGVIRLNANENPYGPSPLARKAMADAIASSNLYPWDVTTQLREKIGSRYGLTKDNVMMGAGSSEILGIVAQFAALKEGNAVTADPTFGIWFTSAQRSGLELIKVPLTADKKHDLQRMKEKISGKTRLVYVCNPNNPTGTVLPPEEIRSFIKDITQNTLVLLDEAYTEYSNEPSLAALVKDNPNLVIAKTFSKIYGMAGARIGYALAHADTIRQLTELQPWANAGASAVSLAGAIASMDDTSFIDSSKKKNEEARNMTANAFASLNIHYIPSHTNFMYYSLQNQKSDLLEALGRNNIRGGRITEEIGKWSRISVGTKEDMTAFIKVLKQSFQS
jgi:histidinol-phosphate aminotransferase